VIPTATSLWMMDPGSAISHRVIPDDPRLGDLHRLVARLSARVSFTKGIGFGSCGSRTIMTHGSTERPAVSARYSISWPPSRPRIRDKGRARAGRFVPGRFGLIDAAWGHMFSPPSPYHGTRMEDSREAALITIPLRAYKDLPSAWLAICNDDHGRVWRAAGSGQSDRSTRWRRIDLTGQRVPFLRSQRSRAS